MGRRLRKDEGLKVNLVLVNADSFPVAGRALAATIKAGSEDSIFSYGDDHFVFHVFKTRAGNWSVMEIVNE